MCAIHDGVIDPRHLRGDDEGDNNGLLIGGDKDGLLIGGVRDGSLAVSIWGRRHECLGFVGSLMKVEWPRTYPNVLNFVLTLFQ